MEVLCCRICQNLFLFLRNKQMVVKWKENRKQRKNWFHLNEKRTSEHIQMWFMNLFSCISFTCHIHQMHASANIVMLSIQKVIQLNLKCGNSFFRQRDESTLKFILKWNSIHIFDIYRNGHGLTYSIRKNSHVKKDCKTLRLKIIRRP